MTPLRVFIVEDHDIYRSGLKTLLATVPELEVAGEATTGEEALARVPEQQPDLVLMDVKMPGMGGVEATRRLVQGNPGVRVLMLTMFDDDPSVFAAMQAGANGYLLKGATHVELLRAIQTVAEGGAVFSAEIATRMMGYFSGSLPGRGTVFEELTQREHEVLTLVAQGLRNGEIARRLGLSSKTVRNHVSNIVAKLQVADRAEAAEQARGKGL